MLFGSVHILPPRPRLGAAGAEDRRWASRRHLVRDADRRRVQPRPRPPRWPPRWRAAAGDELAVQLLPPPSRSALARWREPTTSRRAARPAAALAGRDRAVAGGAYRQVGADAGRRASRSRSPARGHAAGQRAGLRDRRPSRSSYLSGGRWPSRSPRCDETLRRDGRDAGRATSLVKAWMDGDARRPRPRGARPAAARPRPALPPLVVDRNARWTEDLDARLKGQAAPWWWSASAT